MAGNAQAPGGGAAAARLDAFGNRLDAVTSTLTRLQQTTDFASTVFAALSGNTSRLATTAFGALARNSVAAQVAFAGMNRVVAQGNALMLANAAGLEQFGGTVTQTQAALAPLPADVARLRTGAVAAAAALQTVSAGGGAIEAAVVAIAALGGLGLIASKTQLSLARLGEAAREGGQAAAEMGTAAAATVRQQLPALLQRAVNFQSPPPAAAGDGGAPPAPAGQLGQAARDGSRSAAEMGKAAAATVKQQFPGLLQQAAKAYFLPPTIAGASAKLAAGRLVGGAFGEKLTAMGQSGLRTAGTQEALSRIGDQGGWLGRGGRGAAAGYDLMHRLRTGGVENVGRGYLEGGLKGKATMALGAGQLAFKAPGAGLDAMGKLVGSEMAKLGAVMDRTAKFAGRLNALGTPVEQMFGKLGATLAGVASPLGGMTGAVGALGAALAGPVEQLGQIVGQLERFVGLFDPAAVAAMTVVMRDLGAVVGEQLRPLFVGLTPIVRQFADLWATMTPLIQQVTGNFAALVETLSGLMLPAMKLLAPIFETVSTTLQALRPAFAVFVQVASILVDMLVPVLKIVGTVVADTALGITLLTLTLEKIVPVLRFVADGVVSVLNFLLSQLNKLVNTWAGRRFGLKRIEGFDSLAPRQSEGKAAREASFSAIEEFGRKTTLDALRQGQQVTADGKAIVAAINSLGDLFGGDLGNTLKGLLRSADRTPELERDG